MAASKIQGQQRPEPERQAARLTGKSYEVRDLLERATDDLEDEHDTLLQSGVADLGEAIEDLECGVPPEEHEAWLRSFSLDR